MHPTSLINCARFFSAYGESIRNVSPNACVVEIGSQNVNGSIRVCSPEDFKYVGVDFVAGNGVDLVLDDPYVLPFESESVDVVLSNSCFEHSEMFWLLYLEILRVLKPTGLFYLNAPSNGSFHRFPVDCWRFYPDSGTALITWAKRNGIAATLLESYTGIQVDDQWNDFVAVFLKDEVNSCLFKSRIVESCKEFTNGLVLGSEKLINPQDMTEDMLKISAVRKIVF